MVLLEFSMYPVDKGESLSGYVARILDIIDTSGVAYRLTPMGTILEGEWDAVMAVVTQCFEALRADCARVEVALKADYRQGAASRLDSKITSVEDKLGRALKTARD
ncbi:MTH1187 family thiamine-binding protein [Consotaella aegiceratis]|uniref:MTH1187 family thiamine-binding protein n=1 Tax=Consotaella aegiceratis TaxID=3097961 RepID=UPI002F3FF58E